MYGRFGTLHRRGIEIHKAGIEIHKAGIDIHRPGQGEGGCGGLWCGEAEGFWWGRGAVGDGPTTVFTMFPLTIISGLPSTTIREAACTMLP